MNGVRAVTVGHLGGTADEDVARLAGIGSSGGAGAVAVVSSGLPAAVRETIALLPNWPGTFWLLTSGTTSAAGRWVALSGQALNCSAQAVNEFVDSSARDIWVHALPLFHVGGLGILRRARLAGARVVSGIDSRTGKWDPKRFAAAAADHGATLSALVPAQVYDLVARGLQAPRSLRLVIVGGGRLDPDLAQAGRRLGWPVVASYGMTETASQVATQVPAEALRVDGVGEALLRLLPHARLEVGAGGFLRVWAGSLLTAYAHVEPGDGQRRLRIEDPRDAVDGALATLDLGEVPEPGWVRVAGRSGDRVKVLGESVDLEELEGRLRRWLLDAGVAASEFALVALPDARCGHVIHAGHCEGEEWRRRVDAVLEARAACGDLRGFERVQGWTRVAEIPRTALGKVRRGELEQRIVAAR